MRKEPIKIFYSWQSWTPSARNREFIEEALAQALAQIEEIHGQQIIIDRDTKDLPGAPAIADSILNKIEQCDIFLADVSIVVKNDSDDHASPNPNVMLELGYAVKCLTWNRIIMVMNKSLGSPESLPFDLSHRRWPLSYELEAGQQKGPIRNQLIGGFKGAIETILHRGLPIVGERITDTVERLLEQREDISFDKLMRGQIEQVYEQTSSDTFFNKRQVLLDNYKGARRDLWNIGFDLYFPECEQALDVFLSICWYGRPEQAKYVSNATKRWMEQRTNDPQPLTSWRYVPSLFLTYLVGIAAVGNQNWSYLSAVILSRPTRHRHFPSIVEYAFETIAENLVYHYQSDQEPNNSTAGYPIGKVMQETLQPLFERFMPSDDEFNEAFDIFEFLLALHHLHTRIDTNLSKPLLPRYGDYRRAQKRSLDAIMSLLASAGKRGNNWELLEAGMFNGSGERFATVLAAYQERIGKGSPSYDFPFQSSDYLSAYQTPI